MTQVLTRGDISDAELDALRMTVRDADPDAQVDRIEGKALDTAAYDLTLLVLDLPWKTFLGVLGGYVTLRSGADVAKRDVSAVREMARKVGNRARIVWEHPRKEVMAQFPDSDEEIERALEAAGELELDDVEEEDFAIKYVWDVGQGRWIRE